MFSINILRAQPKTPELLKNVNLKMGLTASFFYNFNGEYSYILKHDSYVEERVTNKTGGSLSVVFLFSTGGHSNVLLNLSVLDLKGDINLFNSQTPFGLGYAYLFGKEKAIGIAGMLNLGIQKRMNPTALKTVVYPLNNYTNASGNSILQVGSPVPEAILGNSLEKVTTYSLSIGFIVRL